MESDAVVKTAEIARLLGVSTWTIRAWVKAGRLPVGTAEKGRKNHV
ncbi:MAG: helix-turn-helix domain-containing protein [Planctomycetota bacterium]|nr:helix-turn-helix domain-containing protein [Planctomycetota bacterium]